jgi:hypothetical protein
MATQSPKSLARKISKLENEYENTNPKAVLKLAGIERLASKYQKRLDVITNDPARSGGAVAKTCVVSGMCNKKGKFVGKKFMVCSDTSK